MHRRRFLHAATTGSTVLAAGCSRPSRTTTDATERTRSTSANTTTSGADATRDSHDSKDRDRTDFCWLERPVWENRGVRESLFAFARRHGFAVLLAHPDSTGEPFAPLDDALQAAVAHGIEAWLNVGVLTDCTPEAFVTNRAQREAHLTRLRAIATAYRNRFPTGRIVLWQEAPVGGTWVPGGAWNDAAVANLERYGPAIFAAQKRAVDEAAPGVDVGIFVHFPYIVESRRPETFAAVVDGLQRRGATPDFAFVDFYRGWYEMEVGPETANDAIRSLVANAKRQVGEVLYLGQSHTIDPHHTPSKGAIRMDLRASAAADGRGWYARTAYTETERGFDPFVPNLDVDRVALARDDRTSTVTVARDRYLYAYASLLAARERFDPEERFDCWVRTRDVGFHDRRLSLRTADGDWEFIGDLVGYVSGTPYHGTDHVSVFHALDRERYLADGTLTGRIDPVPGGSTRGSKRGSAGGSTNRSAGSSATRSELVSVSAIPFDVGAYVPEYEAREVLDTSGYESHRLGHAATDARLGGGGAEFCVSIDRPTASGLFSLLFPEYETHRRRLAAAESREEFDLGDRFDCWVALGGGVEEAADALFVSTASGRDRRRAWTSLANASLTHTSTPTCSVFYGLDRRLLPRSDGERPIVGVDRASIEVDRAYAMPYFGSDDVVTAARARSLIDADPAEVETFSLARAWPRPID